MVVPRVGPGARQMDAEVDGAAVFVGKFLGESAGQGRPLLRGQLRGKRYQPLSRKMSIAAQTRVLDRIPERETILRPRHIGAAREVRRDYDLLERDVRAI